MPAGAPSVIAMVGFISLLAARCSGLGGGLTSATAAGAAAARATARRVVAAAFAAAATVRHAFRVGQLVPEAALEPAAQPRELRGVQAQFLLLGHLDRHRLERRQKRRAAERTSACPVAADHLGLVAHADLPHLDADVKLAGQLSDKLAEIYPAFSREVEDQPRAVELKLHASELHAQSALTNLQRCDAERFLLPVFVLEARDDVLAGRDPHDPRLRVDGLKAPFDELGNRSDDGADGSPAFTLHNHLITGVRLAIAGTLHRHEAVRAADRRELDRDETRSVGWAHGAPLYMQ